MYPRILKRICDLILNRRYVVTTHAYDEMAADDLTIWDVESSILTAAIQERQKDAETAEWKYRVRGRAVDGSEVEVVLKISPTDKIVIITVYAL